MRYSLIAGILLCTSIGGVLCAAQTEPMVQVTLGLGLASLDQYVVHFPISAFSGSTFSVVLPSTNCDNYCGANINQTGAAAKLLATKTASESGFVVPQLPGNQVLYTNPDSAYFAYGGQVNKNSASNNLSFSFDAVAAASNEARRNGVSDYLIQGGAYLGLSYPGNVYPSGANSQVEVLSADSWRVTAGGQSLGLFYYEERGGQRDARNYPQIKAQYDVTSVTYKYLNPIDAAPPTVPELAAMSLNVYRDEAPQSTNAFKLVKSLGDFANLGFNGLYAEVYQQSGTDGGRDQIVVAIRGTDRTADYITYPSLVLSSNGALRRITTDLAAQIADLREQYPDANFTLTGHSLGGAVAEALGKAGGVAAVSFNAPGGMTAYDIPALTAVLDQKGAFNSSSTNIVDYRNYGDNVSQVGTHFGDVKTVISSPSEKLIIDGSLPGACLFACHLIKKMVADLNSLSPEIVSGLVVPNPLDQILAVASPSQGTSYNIEGIAKGDTRLVDPLALSNTLQIDLGASTALIDGLYLPGFGTFDIQGLSDSRWVWLGSTAGFTMYGVPMLASYRISGLPQLTDDNKEFMVGLRFGTGGAFRGSVYASTPDVSSQAPEPASWILLITGFGAIGAAMRRRKVAISFA